MKSRIRIIRLFLGILLIGLAACQKDWLDEQPLTKLSQASFWKTESDAMLGLTGVYFYGVGDCVENYNQGRRILMATDDARHKSAGAGSPNAGQFLQPSDEMIIKTIWTKGYRVINMANVFLANIEKVDMDIAKKAQLIAEVKFMRATQYFWMLQWYGGVPLITKVVTIPEANSQTRNSRQEIVDFCLTELTAAAADLPPSRPDAERGRILKSAALAQKGRLLMIEKRWSEAAAAFKEIIDLNVHIIDPRYKALFEEAGETSKEIIYSLNQVAGLYGNSYNEKNFHPAFYGGFQEYNAFQDLIDAFLMTDGLPIGESPLYNPALPFANRDPRLYANMFLPEFTMFNGTLYLAHPALTKFGIKTLVGATGSQASNLDSR
jgi:hypothetical protein